MGTRRMLLPLLVVLAISVAPTLQFSAAAQPAAVVAAIDLSHGQGVDGIDVIVASCKCYWVAILESQEQESNIPAEILQLFDEVRYGGLTAENLADVSILLIGQATTLLRGDEVEAIAQWFTQGGKAVWVAGDSDYPAQGSETAQQVVNQVAEAVGSVVRSDYVSIEEPVENAGRPYRVVGQVDPDPLLSFLAEGLQHGKVLFHGPGALYVLVNGEPVNPLKSPNVKPENVYVIVKTTADAYAVEHQTLENGGLPAELYDPLSDELRQGPFPLMMAEFIGGTGLFIASSETMYGGYTPMTVESYHDVPLDGPRFIGNVIRFMAAFASGTFIVTERTVTTATTVTQTVTQTVTATETVTVTTTATQTVQAQGGGTTYVLAAALILVAGILAAAIILRRK